MKKTIINSISCLCLLMTVIFSACSETYLTFDTSYNGIYFTKDTLEYSFGVTPIEIKTKEYRIPVRVMGGVSSEDRTFDYIIDAKETTAEEGVQYSIGSPIVAANSIDGYIPVILYRDNLRGDYVNGYVRYKLTLRIVESDLFTPTLDSLARVRTFVFDNAVEQPEWLSKEGEKVWYETQWGVWHPYKLIKMVEYFHAIENILPETYEKMVEEYGENLENVPQADFYMYRTIMNKYVFAPMYEYFKNNLDEIRKTYPDFPADFPDPYGVKQ